MTDNSAPAKVSVIIPFYNAALYIKETIASVAAQSFTDFEVVFVDDGSSDESARIIMEETEKHGLRSRVISAGQNTGAANARNIGVQAATGRYIAFLDADDIWDKDKLKKQTAFTEENGYAFTFTDYEYMLPDGERTGVVTKIPDKITYEEALKNTTIFTSTVMLDTMLIDKKDIHMPNVKHEDSALWWALLKKYGAARGLKENLTLYRRAAGSLSSDKRAAVSWTWNLYRRFEGFSVPKSAYYFTFYVINAIIRRTRIKRY